MTVMRRVEVCVWWGKGYLVVACLALLVLLSLGYYRLSIHTFCFLFAYRIANNTSYLFNSIHANTRVRILLPSTNHLTPNPNQRQSQPKHYSQYLQQPPNMPIFRTLTTKIKTSLSPSSSPETSPDGSPTSPQVSSFERISGRKEGGVSGAVKRPEVQTRVDSYMTQGSNASNESVEEKKQRRLSRFREELDFEAED